MSYFAESLKSLRQQADLTMQNLADRAGVSKSMISKIERDEVQPTIDVAARLAHALGKPLSEMLHATQKTPVFYLPKDEQAIWEDANKIKRRNISPVFEGLKIEWLEVELPVGAALSKQPLSSMHDTEKYILLVKGQVEIKIDQQTFHLKAGDSLYFNAAVPHSFYNAGKEVAVYYIVIKHP